MKKILSLSILYILASCSNDNSYVINGSIDVEDDRKIYILQADQNNQPFIQDSTSVKSKQFTFNGVSATPEISYLQVEGINGYVLAILESGSIKANIDTERIKIKP